MSMRKRGFGLYGVGLAVLVWMMGAAIVVAEADEAAEESSEPALIMGSEAGYITQTIDGWIQGAKNRGHFELYDHKKSEMVTLRLDRIVLDDAERVFFPKPGQVAVCGECTQVELIKARGETTRERELGDTYEVWFVLSRGGMRSTRVLDTFIRSVNGQTMFVWTEDSDGEWSATVVPDE